MPKINIYSWSDTGMIIDTGCGSYMRVEDAQRAWDDNAILIAERDALQQRLNAVEEENDRLNTLVGEKRSKIRGLIADQDKLRVKIMRIEHNSPALKILKSLPSELLSLSGCENTAGVSACIEFIQEEIIALENRS